ncbi:hypothetical protein [Halorussus caseinilyticus]|uniref:Uncharacterized protein n=1 Tax=Halorussus caseinilyticus TaxID=3034025 RepID=A0ABD5WM59_9EURY
MVTQLEVRDHDRREGDGDQRRRREDELGALSGGRAVGPRRTPGHAYHTRIVTSP